MKRFAGIDGGGTKTRLVVIDDAAHVVEDRVAGPCNWSSTPASERLKTLDDLLKDLGPVDAVYAACAGVLTSQHREELCRALSDRVPRAKTGSGPDYEAILAAAPESTTAAVIAGTGSVVCSRIATGVVKSGGGGPLLGDHGSAFGIASRAIGALIQGAPSALHADLEPTFGSKRLDDVVAHVYRETSPAAAIARFAPAVFRAALHGDRTALQVIERELGGLAKTTAFHLVRHGLMGDALNIIAAGGLWDMSDVALPRFQSLLAAELPGAEPGCAKLESPPAWGAARLARDLIDEH